MPAMLGQLWHVTYTTEKFSKFMGDVDLMMYTILLNWALPGGDDNRAYAKELWDEEKTNLGVRS